jgi:hypothetical protein
MGLTSDFPAPVWARSLGATGFRKFMQLVTGYFEHRKIEVDVDEAEGVVSPNYEVLARSSVFGLRNIAQKCSGAGAEQWPNLIAEHFDCLFDPDMGETALTLDMRSFQSLHTRLRSRLYPTSILRQTGALAYRPFAEDLIEVLVIDLPKSIRTVAKSEIKVWGLTEDELFAIGRRNLAGSAFLDEMQVSLPGATIRMYTGDALYAASHVMVFERYISEPMPHGIVLTMPKRDVILAHFISNIGVLDAVRGILQVTTSMFEEGPGSLTDNLYWYRNGALTRLPYELLDGSYSFAPPTPFVDLLTDLSEQAQFS